MSTYKQRLSTHDDYFTPDYAWDDIKEFIPKNMVLWECFFGNGNSGKHLRSLGFSVIHEDIDFFLEDRGDILVSNPPFSMCKEVFIRLKKLDKPFIMICPAQKLSTSYFRALFKDAGIQLIIPKKRIQFIKYVDGKPLENYKSSCSFNCYYYCYKMNLPKDITFLE